MKRRGTAMMMCEMCMGMMSMCMFLRAQNDRLLSKTVCRLEKAGV